MATTNTTELTLGGWVWSDCGGESARVVGWFDEMALIETIKGIETIGIHQLWTTDSSETREPLTFPDDCPAALLPGYLPQLRALLASGNADASAGGDFPAWLRKALIGHHGQISNGEHENAEGVIIEADTIGARLRLNDGEADAGEVVEATWGNLRLNYLDELVQRLMQAGPADDGDGLPAQVRSLLMGLDVTGGNNSVRGEVVEASSFAARVAPKPGDDPDDCVFGWDSVSIHAPALIDRLLQNCPTMPTRAGATDETTTGRLQRAAVDLQRLRDELADLRDDLPDNTRSGNLSDAESGLCDAESFIRDALFETLAEAAA